MSLALVLLALGQVGAASLHPEQTLAPSIEFLEKRAEITAVTDCQVSSSSLYVPITQAASSKIVAIADGRVSADIVPQAQPNFSFRRPSRQQQAIQPSSRDVTPMARGTRTLSGGL